MSPMNSRLLQPQLIASQVNFNSNDLQNKRRMVWVQKNVTANSGSGSRLGCQQQSQIQFHSGLGL